MIKPSHVEPFDDSTVALWMRVEGSNSGILRAVGNWQTLRRYQFNCSAALCVKHGMQCSL